MAVNQDDAVATMQKSKIRRLLLLVKGCSKNLILSATRTVARTDGSGSRSSNKTESESSCRDLNFSHSNGLSAWEIENQRDDHSRGHSVNSIASSDSARSDLLPQSHLDLLPSLTRPSRPPKSPLYVRKSSQSHTKISSCEVEKGNNASKMPEVFNTGLHPGKMTITHDIGRSDYFQLAKPSKDTPSKWSTQNLYGSFRIHDPDLTEGPLPNASRSYGDLESSTGSLGHEGNRVPISPIVCP